MRPRLIVVVAVAALWVLSQFVSPVPLGWGTAAAAAIIAAVAVPPLVRWTEAADTDTDSRYGEL